MRSTCPRAWLARAAFAAVTVAGCAPGTEQTSPDGLDARSDLVPTFPVASEPAVPATAPTTPPTTIGVPSEAAPAASGGTGGTGPEVSVGAPPPAAAAITDPAGDATPGVTGAPAWAELLGATLARREQFLELRIRLGAPAPTSSGSAEHTLNVAAFVETDGDAHIDYELWANLADGGWDVAWFNDRAGTGAYSDEAAMDVIVDGPDLVLRFPPEYVGGAETFRWALASEYGTYAALGTPATARDQAPDGGGAAVFPS